MKNVSCFECAFCSEHYPSFKDVCDLDEHEIKEPEKEKCFNFVKAEE